MVTVVEYLQLAVEFLQPTFTALSKRLSSEQEGRVTPFCSCNRSSISRLAKSLKSPLSLGTRKGRSLDKTPIVLVSSLIPTLSVELLQISGYRRYLVFQLSYSLK